jgi:hypothetical protein
MIPQHLHLVSAVSALVWLTAAVGSPADIPTPTPRPGTLAAYASTAKLNRSSTVDANGRVTLTNENLVEIAAEGSLTLGVAATDADKRARSQGDGSASERTRWRAAYFKQHEVISRLGQRRALLEIEIDDIEDQKLDIRTLARLERAKSKLRQLDAQIAGERAELARIVREARRHGAEPGWFR